MPTPLPADRQREISSLFSEIADILKRELALIAERNWDDLPALKKKKALLASRLKSVDSVSVSSGVADLEEESRRKITAQIDLIGHQIAALQNLHLFCRESLSISFAGRETSSQGSTA